MHSADPRSSSGRSTVTPRFHSTPLTDEDRRQHDVFDTDLGLSPGQVRSQVLRTSSLPGDGNSDYDHSLYTSSQGTSATIPKWMSQRSESLPQTTVSSSSTRGSRPTVSFEKPVPRQPSSVVDSFLYPSNTALNDSGSVLQEDEKLTNEVLTQYIRGNSDLEDEDKNTEEEELSPMEEFRQALDVLSVVADQREEVDRENAEREAVIRKEKETLAEIQSKREFLESHSLYQLYHFPGGGEERNIPTRPPPTQHGVRPQIPFGRSHVNDDRSATPTQPPDIGEIFRPQRAGEFMARNSPQGKVSPQAAPRNSWGKVAASVLNTPPGKETPLTDEEMAEKKAKEEAEKLQEKKHFERWLSVNGKTVPPFLDSMGTICEAPSEHASPEAHQGPIFIGRERGKTKKQLKMEEKAKRRKSTATGEIPGESSREQSPSVGRDHSQSVEDKGLIKDAHSPPPKAMIGEKNAREALVLFSPRAEALYQAQLAAEQKESGISTETPDWIKNNTVPMLRKYMNAGLGESTSMEPEADGQLGSHQSPSNSKVQGGRQQVSKHWAAALQLHDKDDLVDMSRWGTEKGERERAVALSSGATLHHKKPYNPPPIPLQTVASAYSHADIGATPTTYHHSDNLFAATFGLSRGARGGEIDGSPKASDTVAAKTQLASRYDPYHESNDPRVDPANITRWLDTWGTDAPSQRVDEHRDDLYRGAPPMTIKSGKLKNTAGAAATSDQDIGGNRTVHKQAPTGVGSGLSKPGANPAAGLNGVLSPGFYHSGNVRVGTDKDFL